MTIVYNDPTWWPTINADRLSSYLTVASFVIILYDWALTFGQEVELVWRQRWSPMTVLCLGVCSLPLTVVIFLDTLSSVPTILLTDTVSRPRTRLLYYSPPTNHGAP
ncbi:hypothetical protein BDR03DRAFT_963728 [Suillus americanus]|nr:hypothetical protein BDR03DRAFT_963728 [Suillus americanus]